MPLSDMLAGDRFLQGWDSARTRGTQEQMQQIQAAGGLMALLQRKQEMEAARIKEDRNKEFQAGLLNLKTPEERAAWAARFAGPEALLTDAQRRTTAENNRQTALARLQQVANQAQQAHEDRITRMTDQRSRDAETQRHNRFMEGLSAHAQQVAGERLFYDTGARVTPPSVASPTQQPQLGPVATEGPADISQATALAKSMMGSGQPFAVGAGFFPADTVAAGGRSPEQAQTPQATPTAPVPPAPQLIQPPPDNLDARDLRLKNMPGAAPAATPAAAPTAAAPAMPQMPPEIAAAPAAVQNRWRLQQTKPSIAGTGSFTPQTLEFVAKQYLTGDRQAVQGFARNATARIALQEAIVAEATKQGMSPEMTAAKIAEFAGTIAGSRTVGQRAANIGLAATEAVEMMSIVKETSDAFKRTNFVPWNMALRAYESGTGSPEIAAFGASINALVNVYARAINPTGVPTVSDKEHARAVINTVQGPHQVDAVLGIMRREMEIAQKAPSQVRASVRESIVGNSGWSTDKERRYQEWKARQTQ